MKRLIRTHLPFLIAFTSLLLALSTSLAGQRARVHDHKDDRQDWDEAYDDRIAGDSLGVPGELKSFAIIPTTALGGKNAIGIIFLNDVTPVDLEVTFTSTNPNVPAPSSVQIRAGESSLSFSIHTTPTVVLTTGFVTAHFDGVTLSAPLAVRPSAVAAVNLKSNSVLVGEVSLQCQSPIRRKGAQ